MILPLVVPTARKSAPSQQISDTPPYSYDRVQQCLGQSASTDKSNKRRVPSSSMQKLAESVTNVQNSLPATKRSPAGRI